MSDDRRAGRTREAREAARRLLDGVARRHRLAALALASENGSLVTGVGDGCELEWLASMAAIGAMHAGAAAHAPPSSAWRLRTLTLAVGPYVLHVGALGEAALGCPPEAACAECEAGLAGMPPLFCCAA